MSLERDPGFEGSEGSEGSEFASSTKMWGPKCREKSRVKKTWGFAVFFLVGRHGESWVLVSKIYSWNMFTLRKNEEMMEVWIYSISMWVEMMQIFSHFFSQTGCFNQLGKGNWVCVCWWAFMSHPGSPLRSKNWGGLFPKFLNVSYHLRGGSWARIFYFHIHTWGTTFKWGTDEQQ